MYKLRATRTCILARAVALCWLVALAPIDDAARLADRSLQGVWRQYPHVHGNADRRLHVMGQRVRRGLFGRRARRFARPFDVDGETVEVPCALARDQVGG